MKRCVFAGSFDPFTKGHLNVVEKALRLYDEVYVALMVNSYKKGFFSAEERFGFLTELFKGEKNVKVVFWDGLLSDFLKLKKITDNVRGIRNVDDKKYEEKMLVFNKALYPEIKNVYISCDGAFKNVSSTAFKKALSSGENFISFIPEKIADKVLNSLNSKKKT